MSFRWLRGVAVAVVASAFGVPCLASALGDANGDGIVSLADYNLVIDSEGMDGANVPGDLDGDGRVTLSDANLVTRTLGRGNGEVPERGPASDLSVRLSVEHEPAFAFDSATFAQVDAPSLSELTPAHQGVTYQVEFFLDTSGGSDLLGNVLFDIEFGPGVSMNPVAPGWWGWNSPSCTVTACDGPPFSRNSDVGPQTADGDATEIRNVLASVAYPRFRRSTPSLDWPYGVGVGETQPTPLGTLFIEWDGSQPSYVSLKIAGTSRLVELDDGDPDFATYRVEEVESERIGGFLSLGGGVPPVEGDFNGDGAVDASDYTVWRDAQGSELETLHVYRYQEWADSYHASVAEQRNRLPEPAAGAIAFFSLAWTAIAVRRVSV